MKAASIRILKEEMKRSSSKELLEICLRLARFKKENKELMTYLLFESQDEQHYIALIKKEIDLEFLEMNKNNIYWIKKSVRKIVRTTNKFIRYSGRKETEVDLLIHFCRCFKNEGISIEKSVALRNIYLRQIEKIRKTINSLHEDLQYDYNEELNELDI